MIHLQQKVESLCSQAAAKNIISWLSSELGSCDKEAIERLLDKDPQQLEELFGKTLAFGTGGVRSLMGMGTNRINAATIQRVTQGLAQVLKRHNPHPGEEFCVVVGYDTRHNSLEFAQETAKVFAGNGIHVYLFKHPEPLALVSFTVRQKFALAGVMITASHNPPEYNGYKVYMSTGGQVLPPLDHEIIQEQQHVEDILSASSVKDPYIHLIGEESEKEYIQEVHKLQLYPEDNRVSGQALSISYSPLHGGGVAMVPRVLKDWSFSQVKMVESQSIPDGSFPTVKLPNPEDAEAMALGIKQMVKNHDDIFIATDPDADRLGVVCLDTNNQPYRFNGNQIACLLADHIFKARTRKSSLGKEHILVKSLVTTEMLEAIVRSYGGSVVNVGTGFKYIGEKIESWRESVEQYVFGAEESYGYLYGSYVEDKDGVSSSALVAEAALQQKLQGKNLRSAILDLYELHGYYINKTISISFSTSQEEQEMRDKIEKLASIDFSVLSFEDKKVERFEDYQKGKGMNIIEGTDYALFLPKMCMLCFFYQDGGKIIIRPSGTEPKVKLYFELVNRYSSLTKDRTTQEARERESEEKLEMFISHFRNQLSSL